jgi:hypothetical protein
MATLANNNPTLLDVANMPENKDVKDIIDLMAQFNPILADALALPCNMGTYHSTTVRTGLPTPVWGRLYKGVPSTKGTRQVIKDTTGFLESASEVDTRLVDDIEGAMQKASIRFEEAEGHLEALSQEIAKAIFYHDSGVDPEKPMGFSPRFSTLVGAENISHVIDGGGVGSTNTSIWMITWDRKACHLLYPLKGKAGIERIDQGKVPKLDASGNTFFVYREDFKWHLGVSVRDWRYVVRVCNIDVNSLSVTASTGANLITLMTEMYYRHYGRKVNSGKTYIYANTAIVKYLDFQARNVTGVNLFLTLDQQGPNAKEVLRFRGIEIHESDALLSTEARVV